MWPAIHLNVTKPKSDGFECQKALTLVERRVERPNTFSNGRECSGLNSPVFNHFPRPRLWPNFGRSNAYARPERQTCGMVSDGEPSLSRRRKVTSAAFLEIIESQTSKLRSFRNIYPAI